MVGFIVEPNDRRRSHHHSAGGGCLEVSGRKDGKLKKDPHVLKAIANVQLKCEKIIQELTGKTFQTKN
jgi:hypothetical protein